MAATITRTYTFANGGVADGGQVDSEIQNIVNTVNNLDTAVLAWTNVKAGIINATTSLQAASILPAFSATLGTIALADSLSTIIGKIMNARIVQIVQGTFATFTSTTSASFGDSGLSVSITPQLSANKVLILASGVLFSGTQTVVGAATLVRGATNLAGAGNNFASIDTATGGGTTVPCAMVYLDSPSTTSATTYKVQIQSDGTHAVQWGQNANSFSSIICVEVGS